MDLDERIIANALIERSGFASSAGTQVGTPANSSSRSLPASEDLMIHCSFLVAVAEN
jgi:hypothetical protein